MSVPDDERGGKPSASTAPRLYYCLGSLKAEEGLPDGPQTKEATQGTAVHKALETGDWTGLDDEEEEITFKLHEMAQTGADAWQANFSLQTPTTEKEIRYWIHDDYLSPVISAKCDLAMFSGKHAFLVDYKTGFKDVTEAVANVQIRVQALCVWAEHPELEHIRVSTAQYRFKGKSDFVDYDLELLRRSRAELDWVLWRANQLGAPRVPGKWCDFCKAKDDCREAAALTMLPIVTLKGDATFSKDQVMDRLATLTYEELKFIWDRSGVIEKILFAVSARLKQLPPDELDALGLKIKSGNKVRTVKDMGKVWDVARNWMDTNEFVDVCDVSVGKMSKILEERVSKERGITKKDAKKLLEKAFAESIEKVQRAGSIVEK